MLTLMEMSFYASGLILVTAVLRKLLGSHMPKTALGILWAAALARLLLPFQVSFPASVYNIAAQLNTNRKQAGLLLAGTNPASQGSAPGFSVWGILWVIGAISLALALFISHLHCRRCYQSALPVEDPFLKSWMEQRRLRRPVRLCYSDQIDSPLTCGILRPIILLPKHMDWQDEQGLHFILAHEMAHIRRFDTLIKWILAAALCLHWFNPLVWLMYLLMNRDLELACDAAVLRQYGQETRRPYALTLVSMAEQRHSFAPLTNGFSKNSLQERITAILAARKHTALGIALGAVLALALIALLVTTPPTIKAATAPQGGVATAENNVTTNVVFQNDVVQEIADDAFESGTYTQAQYDLLVKKLYHKDYTGRSIASFNREINAALNTDEDDSMRRPYEIVTSYLPDSGPMAGFLRNTVHASQQEYSARLEEVYSHKRTDPEFRGEAKILPQKDDWESPKEPILLSYDFTYKILDQDKLTVGERDAFLQEVMQAAQNLLETGIQDKLALAKELTAACSEADTEKIVFTGIQHAELIN